LKLQISTRYLTKNAALRVILGSETLGDLLDLHIKEPGFEILSG
jgi:hypothetical protein